MSPINENGVHFIDFCYQNVNKSRVNINTFLSKFYEFYGNFIIVNT